MLLKSMRLIWSIWSISAATRQHGRAVDVNVAVNLVLPRFANGTLDYSGVGEIGSLGMAVHLCLKVQASLESPFPDSATSHLVNSER
jgi:hypothetical protein